MLYNHSIFSEWERPITSAGLSYAACATEISGLLQAQQFSCAMLLTDQEPDSAGLERSQMKSQINQR